MNVWDLLLNTKESKEQENEEDIKKACIWLREAGFPQYVQMFTEKEFPISLKLVQEDHMDFDGGSLMALFRRIEILNKAAEIKSSSSTENSLTTITQTVSTIRKPYYEIIEDPDENEENEEIEKNDDEDENDDKENILEQTALSSNWCYEPRTRRWSKTISVSAPEQKSSKLEAYLGITHPRPFESKPDDNTINISNYQKSSNFKRPNNLTFDSHRSFEPILESNPELNDPVKDNDIDTNDKVMSSIKDKDKHSISTDKKSRSAVSPSVSPDVNIQNNFKGDKEKEKHSLFRATSLKKKIVSRVIPNQCSLRLKKNKKSELDSTSPTAVNSVNTEVSKNKLSVPIKEIDTLALSLPNKQSKYPNESYSYADNGFVNLRTGSFISRNTGHTDSEHSMTKPSIVSDLDPVISLLESDVSSLDIMRSKMKLRASPDSAPSSPVLRSKTHRPIIKKDQQRLSDFESYTQTLDINKFSESNKSPRISSPDPLNQSLSNSNDKNWSMSTKINRNQSSRWSHSSHLKEQLFPQYHHLLELSVGKINILKKLSILSCTSLLEKHCPSQKNVFNWKIPRLLPQKQKTSSENSNFIFGVNLSVHQNRYGQPFPPVILNIFNYLREHGPSTQGIFRKTGMKFRIKELRKAMEEDENLNDFDEYSVNDVGDILKTFFRDLPDRLLTHKLSSTLLAIYSYVPKESQLEGLKWALFSLPDENRMALEYLIEFLSCLATFSEVTKMDAKNLSLCFAPSLFNFQNDGSLNNAMSPLKLKKSNGPNSKLLAEQNAAYQCVMGMINNSHGLFQITSETLKKVSQNAKEKSEPKNINLITKGGSCQDWIREKISTLKNDSTMTKTGWTNISKDFIKKLHGQNAVIEQLSFRKIGSHHNSDDGIALRTWKIVVDIEVPPGYLFTNIKDKRHLWDPDISTVEVVKEINEYVDIVKYVSLNPDGSFIEREFNLLRGYQLSVNGSVHMIFSESINTESIHSLSLGDNFSAIHGANNDFVGQIFADNFVLEALSTKLTRVTWISRVDIYGHHSDWYNHWGHNMIRRVAQLKKFSKDNCSLRLSNDSGLTTLSDSINSPMREESSPVFSSQNVECAPETVL